MADPDRGRADESSADRPVDSERRGGARAAAGRDAGAPPQGAPGWNGVERRRTDRRRGIGAGPAASERRGGADRRGLMFHVRDFATKFREPLIGVGVAAASLPLIKAGQPAGKGQPTEPPAERAPASPEAASAAATAAQPNRDVDAEVGAQWSDVARRNTVQAAVDRYGIAPDLARSIYDHAMNEGIDPKLAYGLVKTESGFRHTAVSNVGARGLTQLMPGTANNLEPGSARDLFDPETSLKLGFRYLRQLIDRYNGDRHLALTAYNRGPGTVDRAVSRGRNPDNGYAGMVLGNALRGATGAGGQTPG